MQHFVVSARKYRPQRFDEVVGQEHVAKTLKNALANNTLAHSFLFCGPRGVGKTTCARILAKTLNCENLGEDFEPCNTCNSCTSFNENASFNITELDAASNNSVENIRALTEQVRFAPQQGEYKVFIIDEVHMLSSAAFNAFLKTLEEPPSYAKFILATTEKHKILPTILSRCQIFDFKRIQVSDIVKHLKGICEKEGVKADEEALHIIGQKADGALRDALSIYDRLVSFGGKEIKYADVLENLNVLDHEYFFKVAEALAIEDIPAVLNLFDEILNNGFDADLFINGLAGHFRDLLVCKNERSITLLDIPESLKKRYVSQAQNLDQSFLLTSLDICNTCDVNYRMARNKRLHVEMALIKMAYIQKARKVTPLQTPVSEKKTPERKDSKPEVVEKLKEIPSEDFAPVPETIEDSIPDVSEILQAVEEPSPEIVSAVAS
ncbi:MAG: DNA polymerase III subunit gamma/tau, partial [Saprospiraceae bacterium]|nr:DNA polymerase III subunit gamma/tau [Saprospiraceae bacterium]